MPGLTNLRSATTNGASTHTAHGANAYPWYSLTLRTQFLRGPQYVRDQTYHASTGACWSFRGDRRSVLPTLHKVPEVTAGGVREGITMRSAIVHAVSDGNTYSLSLPTVVRRRPTTFQRRPQVLPPSTTSPSASTTGTTIVDYLSVMCQLMLFRLRPPHAHAMVLLPGDFPAS